MPFGDSVLNDTENSNVLFKSGIPEIFIYEYEAREKRGTTPEKRPDESPKKKTLKFHIKMNCFNLNLNENKLPLIRNLVHQFKNEVAIKTGLIWIFFHYLECIYF